MKSFFHNLFFKNDKNTFFLKDEKQLPFVLVLCQRVFECVRVRVRTSVRARVCVYGRVLLSECVCVCVCGFAGGAIEGERVCVCVCVCKSKRKCVGVCA